MSLLYPWSVGGHKGRSDFGAAPPHPVLGVGTGGVKRLYPSYVHDSEVVMVAYLMMAVPFIVEKTEREDGWTRNSSGGLR